MSLAINYAGIYCGSEKNFKLQSAFHALRKTQLRVGKLVLEHAVVTMLTTRSKPIELVEIQADLEYTYHIHASRRTIKKLVLKPLCKEHCVTITYRTTPGGNEEQTRFYASTADLRRYHTLLEQEIIQQYLHQQ